MTERNAYKWYVLKTISGKENKVKEYIDSALVTSSLFKEYVLQVLIPREKIVSLRKGKRTIKERNILPGYILVECNLTDECYPLLRNIPGVLGFLSDKKGSTHPVSVSQSEVSRIIGEIEESNDNIELEVSFSIGDRVKIVDGPFVGFNGIISDVFTEKHKIRVDVTIFDRQTPLELSFNQVVKE